MPVQYRPIPEFETPNLNLMGAFAQGQALASNALLAQEREADLAVKQRAAQNQAFITDLARRGIDIASSEGQKAALAAGVDLPTTLSYGKAAQEFSAGTQAAKTAKFDYEQKFRDYAMKRLLAVPPGNDEAYHATLNEFKDYFPGEYEYLRKLPWNDDTRRQLFSTAEQQLAQTVVEANVPGGKERRAYPTYNPLAGEKVVPGSFASTQEKWTPVRGAKQEIEYYTNDAGTKILTPEQYKAMAQGNAAAAPAGRGQAGAFTPGNMTEELVAGREGFKATPYFDVNADRIGYGSSTVTREDGTVEKVHKGMAPITEEDARRDLRRRLETEFAPKAAAKVGEDVWARLPENVRAPLTSIAYNYGTIPSRIVPAVQSGNPETIARAIESLAGDNKGVNAGRRMQEANIARGTAFPGSRAVPAFAATGTPEFMGGPQIQPPINMMAAPVASPVNAMVAPPAPAPAPAPIAQPTPQPQATPITAPVTASDDVKQRQAKFIANAPLGQSAKYRGKVDLENMLTNFANELEYLKEQDAIPSTSNTAARNAEIASGASWLGQAYGRFTGTPAQSTRDAIDSIRQNLVSVLARATGKTAQELNSNFDVKNAIKALGEPKATIESIRATINNINKTFGTNVDISGAATKSETRKQIEASKAAPTISEAAGIDPAAIKMLRDNPDTASAFDAHFGTPGLAAKILGR